MQQIKIFNNSGNDLPKYGTEKAAGFDLQADFSKIENINDIKGNGEYSFDKDDNDNLVINLEPGGRILIPTNIHIDMSELNDLYEVQIRPRSGVALKHGITMPNSPGTIDADYQGNIGIILMNTDMKNTFTINQGDRIAQGVLNKVEQIEWEQVETMDDFTKTERGDKGFGSTGK
jgi:dUTP pyrophosphatase